MKDAAGNGREFETPTGRRWFVVCSRPHAEKRALFHLRNQQFDCFLPLHQKTVRHARQFRSVEAPLFSRYLFVRLDLERDRWRSVLGTQGVSCLIMEGERPKPIMPGVVEALLDASDAQGLISNSPDLSLGDIVRLQTGPFSGMVGELLTLGDDGRVSVLLNLLGLPTIVKARHLGLVPAA